MLDSLTLVGNLTKDPELRYTPSGAAVVTLRIASAPRRYDRTAGQYVDGPTTYIDAIAWRGLAENVMQSLKTGARVVVVGRLHQRRWETPDKQVRVTTEIDADVVAADLTFHTVSTTKVKRDRPGRERWDAGLGQGAATPSTAPDAEDETVNDADRLAMLADAGFGGAPADEETPARDHDDAREPASTGVG